MNSVVGIFLKKFISSIQIIEMLWQSVTDKMDKNIRVHLKIFSLQFN